MSDFSLLIDGALVPGAKIMPVINPATAHPFADSPRASEEQMNKAVAAAARAFPSWSGTSIEARRNILVQMADAVAERADDLLPLLVCEHGMTLAAARIELMIFGFKLRQAAAAALPTGVIDAGPGHHVEQRLAPLGVVAAIIPWNVPLTLFGSKIASALLVGNCVVAKPAPTTPLTTLRIGAIVAELLPPGVLNIVTDANDLGSLLCRHPDVRMISFTGSTATGQRIMESSAGGLKRLLLELGGNDPAIVLADADVALAASTIYESAFFNCGQACIATKRVYVHRSLQSALCDALGEKIAATRIGDGMSGNVDYGPIQNKAQYDRIVALIDDAERLGTVVARGEAQAGEGYFVAPRLVTGVDDNAPVVREEQFGPILPVLTFDDVDDAIARSNATPFGLAASVYSTDVTAARAVAQRLEAGTVNINKIISFHPAIPFSGAKLSGFGIDGGQLGLLNYGQIQIVDEADLAAETH
ncbi:aldehyde dehydrogenase [Novosphingobium endophyticum]|uniref:Aldehyde dehydrogenase n=1 Tax=Novosphingobium endophyticum TaxID=1955250 RepID=A0A916TW73_9SPHN|nr:aldehyde dehydrogenase family protein [Novosphingobium endophyticum]GGC15627.1 aldehyde dehydrogenase [Novosphingobium endophyticum]